MVTIGDIKVKLEAYCLRHSDYTMAFDETSQEFVIDDSESQREITLKIDNGKVKCSDMNFLEDVLSFVDDNGGSVPAIIDDFSRQDITTLMAGLPSDFKELKAETVMASMCPGGTPQQFINFLMFCKENDLNPFRQGEAYWIMMEDGKTTHVVGMAALVRKATENPDFEKMDCGVIVLPKKNDSEVVYRQGEFYVPQREDLLGGWCAVYLKSRGKDDPIRAEVMLSEYTTGKSTWSRKPATMSVKTAKAHACRLAAPKSTGGLYIAEELGIDPAKEVPISQEA